MRIQIVYRDGTQKVWETQGVPAGRESVPTAYGVEWDLWLKHTNVTDKDGNVTAKRVALVLTTTASSAKGAIAAEGSPAKGATPQERADAAKIASMNVTQLEKEQAKAAHDTDVKVIAKMDYEGEKIDTITKLLDAIEDRGGVARMVIDGEIVYPPMDGVE